MFPKRPIFTPSELGLNAFKDLVEYLDWINETDPGEFVSPVPIFSGIGELIKFVPVSDSNGNNHYAEKQYQKAAVLFTYQLKALWAIKEYSTDIVSEAQVKRYRSIGLYNRGNTYDELKEYHLALKDYAKALELGYYEPWHLYNNRAHVYESLLDFDKAYEDIQRAIDCEDKIYPNFRLAYERIRSKWEQFHWL